MSILVITPATGSPELIDAIRSVREQSVEADHLIVVDGSKFSERVTNLFKENDIQLDKNLIRCDLPFNTGANGFYGHRVFAAFSHLINHEYVLFLDQDNYFGKDHVKELVKTVVRGNYDWAYSLRTIVDKDGVELCKDNCESLGRWPAWVGETVYLIDSSSYCFKTSFIRKVGHIWDFGWGADRRFYNILKDQVKHEAYGCTGKHSLYYRLGGNEGSVTKDFFVQGNEKMLLKYNKEENFPWLK